jgi:hypothetical protein
VDAHARLEGSEAVRTAAEERIAELEGKVSTLAELEGRALRAETALAESTSKLEAAEASLTGSAAPLQAASGDGSSAADLQARVAELEAARRTDITELQRAQESLANTQVELTNVNRRLKEAEARVRELEGGPSAAPEPERPAVPVPDYVTRDAAPAREPAYASAAEAGYEAPAEMSSFAARLSSLRQEIAAATQPAPETVPPPEEEPTPPAQEEEGLSLRERLARAAAARHRGPLT